MGIGLLPLILLIGKWSLPIYMHGNPTIGDPEWKLFLCCGGRYHLSELKGFGEIGGPYCPVCEVEAYTDQPEAD